MWEFKFKGMRRGGLRRVRLPVFTEFGKVGMGGIGMVWRIGVVGLRSVSSRGNKQMKEHQQSGRSDQTRV